MNYKPKLLFLEITSECNLRCKQCFMWKLKDDERGLKDEEYLYLIEEFNKVNGDGAVILTGGEIFLKSNLVFSILSKCNEMNIETVVNTNGTLIPTDKYFELATNGPNKLVFSLDSHKEELHDYISGIKGTFQNVISSIERLVAFRNKVEPNDKKIYISTILHNENINEIGDIISFAKSLKIDGIVFQALTPTFYSTQKIEKDYFFNKHFFKDIDNAVDKIDKLIQSTLEDTFILNSFIDLSIIKEYIRSPYFTNSLICNAHERNLVVDHSGNLKYCYNMEAIFPETVGNVRLNKITDIIYSDKSKEAREKMKSCNLSCGILNCNK